MSAPAYRSPLLQPPLSATAGPAAGAVEGEGPDAGVAAHYGAPLREQRALDRGRALVDLSHRAVLSVSGPDRLEWLHTLTTQHLSQARPGTSTEALFLDANGRIEHGVHLLEDGAACWLILDRADEQALLDWLTRMRFAHEVTLRRHTGTVAVVGATAAVPGWEDRTVWIDPWPEVAPGGWAYSGPDHPGEDWSWREYLVTRDDLLATAARLGEGELAGWSLAGTSAAEALRIAAGRPRPSVDADAKALPHELDLLRTAVHLEKGCYRGQETIARVHNLGRPPRRLVQLLMDGSGHAFPAPGAPVIVRPEPDTEEARAAARPVGVLTSVGQHHEAGHLGLALVKRSVPVDAQLIVRDDSEGGAGHVAASQEVLVAPDAGQVVGRPDVRRR